MSLGKWNRTTFGKVMKVSSGKGLPKYKQDSDGDYIVYGGNGAMGRHSGYLYEDSKLIIGRVGAQCGNTHITKPYSWITDNAFVAEFDETLYDQTFLWYLVQNLNLIKYSKSTAQPVISGRAIKNVPLTLPPLPEQRAIVAKLERLLGELDRSVAELEAARAKVGVYRQSVLREAFAGRLTGEQAVKPEFVKLGSHIEKPKYGTSKKCTIKEHGIPVLRIPNLKDGFINTNELKYAEFDHVEVEKYSLEAGDLLTIRSNGSVDLVGKTAVIRSQDTNYLYAGYLIRLRPLTSLSSKYLHYCLSSITLRIQIESKAKSTSGVNNINSKELQDLNIPYFSIEIQQQIVQGVESRFSVADHLERTIEKSLVRARGLRQGVLGRAFAGELTITYK